MKDLLFAFLLLWVANAYGLSININHGPYICDMDSTSCTIMWTTDRPGMAWVEIAEMGDDHFYAYERQKIFDARDGRKIVNDTVHQVRIQGLRPDTRYRYRIFTRETTFWEWNDNVRYGDVASSAVYQHDPYTFRTFPAQPKDAHFIVLNDIHERADFMTDLCRNIDFGKVDFVVLNGDMASNIEKPESFLCGYVDSLVSLCATSVPVFMLRGNHETRGVFADSFLRYFPTANGHYYRMKHLFGIDFLFVDSGEDKPDSDIEYGDIADFDNYRIEQAMWLRQLRTTRQVGEHPLVVFCHMPPSFEAWHGPIHLRSTVVPELNEMNVSVMLSGHLHYHAFKEPDDIVRFPNLVNSNNAYLDCRIHGGKLTVDCVGLDAKENRRYTFDLKR